jgi:hypothetical protein
MLQTKAYLTIVIYDRKTFIVHATGVIKLFTGVIKMLSGGNVKNIVGP